MILDRHEAGAPAEAGAYNSGSLKSFRAMNPLLARLQPYPFERLRALFAGIAPDPARAPINLSLGEPKHPTPEFIKQALAAHLP